MEAVVSPLPDDIEALKALLASATQRANEAEAKLANAHARESATEAVIAHLKLQIAKLRREQYGASAERTRRLLDQMELQLEDLETDAAEDDLATEVAAEKTATVTAFERKRSAWRLSGWCWPYFSNSSMARKLGPAQPRGTTWKGAGGCVIISQSRQENFSRTV